MESGIVIEFDNRKLNIKYEIVDPSSDSEEMYVYAIYDEIGADLYDYYEEQGDLDSITESVYEQLERESE